MSRKCLIVYCSANGSCACVQTGLGGIRLEKNCYKYYRLLRPRLGHYSRVRILRMPIGRARIRPFEGDIWKYKGMTEQVGPYEYAVGLYLVIDLKAGTVRSEIYVDAKMDEPLTEWMRLELVSQH